MRTDLKGFVNQHLKNWGILWKRDKDILASELDRLRKDAEALYDCWLSDPVSYPGYKQISDNLNEIANNIESAYKRIEKRLYCAIADATAGM